MKRIFIFLLLIMGFAIVPLVVQSMAENKHVDEMAKLKKQQEEQRLREEFQEQVGEQVDSYFQGKKKRVEVEPDLVAPQIEEIDRWKSDLIHKKDEAKKRREAKYSETMQEKVEQLKEQLKQQLSELRSKDPKNFDKKFKDMSYAEKLKLFRSFKSPKRLALALLVDHGIETPAKENAGAITDDLKNFLQINICILASCSLVYNLLSRKMADLSELLKTFTLYVVQGTQFIFFVPKEIDQLLVKKYFDIDDKNRFEKVTGERALPEKFILYLEKRDLLYIKDLSQFRNVFKNQIDFKNIKEKNKRPEVQEIEAALVVYLTGHGLYGGDIANLPVKVMQGLLEFFKGKISLLFVSTCYGGGKNKEFMSFYDENKRIVRSLPYTLVVQGVEDVPVTVIGPMHTIFKDLSEGREVGDVFSKNAVLFSRESGFHAQKNIPQILYPGTNNFVPITFSDRIARISSSFSRAREFGVDEPITLWADSKFEKKEETKDSVSLQLKKDPLIVLIYPEKVTSKIWVRPLNSVYLSRDPNFKVRLWEAEKKAQQKDLISDEGDAYIPPQESFFGRFMSKIVSPRETLLFPIFVPMNSFNTREIRQAFDSIEVASKFYDESKNKTVEVPAVGVLKFIRDAFFDVDKDQATLKIITIHLLKGKNDLFSFLKNKGEQETELGIDLKDEQEIVLENVVVRAGFDRKTGEIIRQLAFKFKNKYWRADSSLKFVEEKDFLDEEKDITKIAQYAENIKSSSWYVREFERMRIQKLITDGKNHQEILQALWQLKLSKDVSIGDFSASLLFFPFDDQAIFNIVQETIKSSDINAVEKVVFFWQLLKNKGLYVNAFIALIQEAMDKGGWNIQSGTKNFWDMLFREGYGFSAAIKMLREREIDYGWVDLELCTNLVEHKQGIDIAKEVAADCLKNTRASLFQLINLSAALVSKGHGFNIAKMAALKGLEELDSFYFMPALNLLIELAKKGEYLSDVLLRERLNKAIQKIKNSSDLEIKKQAEIVYELYSKY